MNTDTMGTLAETAATKLVALQERLAKGDIDVEQFVALAVAVLAISRARAVALSDLALAAELSVLRGKAVPTLGLPLPDTTDKAVRATLESPQYAADALAAVGVLGRAETLTASQDAYSRGLRAHRVPGWTRVLNSGACELCEDLAGPTLPASADPYHHRGCGCSTRPVLEGESA